jgi:hypothetical protein
MVAPFTIEKRTKANVDFSYRCKIVVKKTIRLYTENLKHSAKKNTLEYTEENVFKK